MAKSKKFPELNTSMSFKQLLACATSGHPEAINVAKQKTQTLSEEAERLANNHQPPHVIEAATTAYLWGQDYVEKIQKAYESFASLMIAKATEANRVRSAIAHKTLGPSSKTVYSSNGVVAYMDDNHVSYKVVVHKVKASLASMYRMGPGLDTMPLKSFNPQFLACMVTDAEGAKSIHIYNSLDCSQK